MHIPKTKRLAGGVVSLALVASGVMLGVSSLSASGAVAYNRATTTCAKTGYDPRFIKQIDAIVSWGVTPSAHNHGFYGLGFTYLGATMGAGAIKNVSDAAGHPEDPGYGPFASNCSFYGDWPAYWFPTPKWNGADILPGKLRSTYQSPAGTTVVPPPFGAEWVSGSASATAPTPHVRWTCGDIDGVSADHPIDCTSVPNGVVTGEITFPDCWDGTTDIHDTPGGIGPSHFSYSTDGKCPDGFTPCVPAARMAQLVTQQTFTMPNGTPMVNPLNADGSTGLSFSSGPYYTYHGDYMNFWSTRVLNSVIAQCLNTTTPNACPPGTYVGTVNPTHRLD